MKEMIVRVSSKSDDVEVLINNLFTDEIIEKKITSQAFLDLMSKRLSDREEKVKCKFFDSSIIAYGCSGKKEVYVVNQPEHRRYITYSVGSDNDAYEINFPSSIYVIEVKKGAISNIKAFMYLEYEGQDTKLYKYAMANMLSDNDICIGNAKRKIEESVIKTLEGIIYAPYSHATLNNIKGFRSTKSYFEYLSQNHISHKYLYSCERTLGNVVNEAR